MDHASGKTSKKEVKPKKSGFMEILEAVVVAVVLAALIRIFVFSPFYIPSGSMEPTLQIGDRIIVSKINYRFEEPERGDIIVFKFPLDPNRDFVKRVVGLEGETIAARDGVLYINGKRLEEDYLPQNINFPDFGPEKIPQGCYFMMGDNRNNSDDSRNWGPLPEEYIIGQALLVYWPPSRLGLLY